MTALFFWFVPPAIGALIGYVTNAVAIKMLFRPLKPVKIFGIKLPFTPGVLPRERHKLADSIGSMVERKLLTPEILRKRFLREDVRAGINASIAKYTGKVLNSPLGDIFAGKKEISPIIVPIFRDFFCSPSFNSLLNSFLVSVADYAENTKITLGELLGEERSEILQEKFKHFVRETLSSQAPRIAGYAGSALDDAFPGLVRQLVQFLMKNEIHREMEIQGRVFLNNAILKLSVLQRFFISAGQYDKTLSERMPEIIDDLIGQLESLLSDADIRKRLIAFAEELVHNLVSRDLPLDMVTQIVFSPALFCFNMPLGEAVKKLSAGEPEKLILRIYGVIKQNSMAGIEEITGSAVNRLLETHRDTVFSDFLRIDGSKKEKIDTYIGDEFLKVIDKQIGELLRTINVRTLVSERIDSLDMIDVEHIVLDVMASQLKWINVFGAILGALIGGVQVLLTWFTT